MGCYHPICLDIKCKSKIRTDSILLLFTSYVIPISAMGKTGNCILADIRHTACLSEHISVNIFQMSNGITAKEEEEEGEPRNCIKATKKKVNRLLFPSSYTNAMKLKITISE